MNFYDLCPDTGAGELADEDGCSWEQYDDDADGVLNELDSCPTTAGQSVDADGCAEYQKDDDDDGVMNNVDTCPGTLDGDTIPDGCDSLLDIDDGGGRDDDGSLLPAPSLVASVAAVAVIALRRRY